MGIVMIKTEYRKARRLVRDNGKFATRWMTLHVAHQMLNLMQQADDVLSLRNRWGRYETTKGRLTLWPLRG